MSAEGKRNGMIGVSGKGLPVFIFFSLCHSACHLVIGLEQKQLPEKQDFRCAANEDCDDGYGCTQDICELTKHTCEHYVMVDGTLCREKTAENICDVASEYCDGTSYDCPDDTFEPATLGCRPSAGQCDEAEYCTGDDPKCPDDAFSPSSKACDDGDDCTHDDRCDGVGGCAGINGLHDVEQISIGPWGLSTCALLPANDVRCCGSNNYGQLGDGTKENKCIPVPVAGLPGGEDIATLSCGGRHHCVLLASGKIMCWGLGDTGQLGDGVEGPDHQSHAPVDVVWSIDPDPIVAYGWTQVSGGYLYSCAMQENGTSYCWGKNNYGQLGNGTYDNASVPVQVTGVAEGSIITAGSYHTCAIDPSGSLMCWGYNERGQLGNPAAGASSPSPVSVEGISSRVLQVTLGTLHTCALLEGGEVMCWGTNEYGQLGVGLGPDSDLPVAVSGLPPGVLQIASGYEHTCALLDGGGVMCWGHNDEGQIGDGTVGGTRDLPVIVPGLSGVASVATGTFHTCVLLEDATARCWGHNVFGELGIGEFMADPIPVPVEMHCN
jgi:alpha-tubulin suppressor-like RCC1 family protein